MSAATGKSANQALRVIDRGLLAAFAGVATLPPLVPGDEIYDIKESLLVPIPWGAWTLQLLFWVAAIWLGWKAFAWFVSPRPMQPAPPPPPPDPLKEALAALGRLKTSPIWQEGQVKNVCESLTTILKAYLKDKFRLGLGPAATTTELMSDLQRRNIKPDWITRTGQLLELCDGIKFARGTLGSFTLESLFQGVLELIQRGEWQQ